MVDDGPAVVLPFDHQVNFVAVVRTVLGGKQLSCARLKIESLGISMSVTPNGTKGVGAADKRVVGGNGAVRMQPQDLAGKRIESLGERRLVRVARRKVEAAVRAESKP